MPNLLKILKSWLSHSTQAPASPPEPSGRPAPLAVRHSFRSDMSGDSEEGGDLAVISEKEWDIQERTRERMKEMRYSHSANDVLQDDEGEAREGASLDWDIATSESMESVSDKLSAQQAARDERGAHHMGSPVVPLLPSPEDAQLAGCGRLIRDAGCEWIEQMVRDGVIRPKVESGSRMTLEVVPSGVSVSVDLSKKGEAAFSAGEREFADANEMEAWLRKWNRLTWKFRHRVN